MNESEIRNFLNAFQAGEFTLDHAIERLRQLPFEDLGFAKIDHHRSLRQGFPEVVYAKGKTPEQVAQIVQGMMRASESHNILVTRANASVFAAVKRVARPASAAGKASKGKPKKKPAPQAEFHELSGTILIRRNETIEGKGLILVVSAGTSDIP